MKWLFGELADAGIEIPTDLSLVSIFKLVMAVLGRFPDLSANEVAERTAMDKVAVSRAVARLLERGLIKREIHSDDRRRSVLALSEVGYTVYDEIAPMALACEQRLIATLDAEERATLDRLLVKLGGPGLAALRDGA